MSQLQEIVCMPGVLIPLGILLYFLCGTAVVRICIRRYPGTLNLRHQGMKNWSHTTDVRALRLLILFVWPSIVVWCIAILPMLYIVCWCLMWLIVDEHAPADDVSPPNEEES